MAYDEEINRANPSAFLFLIDQSGSMSAPFGRPDKAGSSVAKAQEVANALNANIEEVINRCQRPEGIRDYFEVGLIGYGQQAEANFCWTGQLARRDMVPLSEVARHYEVQQIEEEVLIRKKVEKIKTESKVWVTPVAEGITPMKSALELARRTLEAWVKQHPQSYPPIVINITDGEATDADDEALLNAATALTSLTNSNGSKVLLINCHISGLADYPVVFPAKREEVPVAGKAQVLFQMSSTLPAQMKNVAAEILAKSDSQDPIRGMIFNGNAVLLVKFLDIGTRPALQNVEH